MAALDTPPESPDLRFRIWSVGLIWRWKLPRRFERRGWAFTREGARKAAVRAIREL